MTARSKRMTPIAAVVSLVLLALGAQPASATHVECDQTITEDTTLDSDLTNCHLRGVVIGAPNVTLDLNGHVIDGSEPTGEPAGSEGVVNGFHPGKTRGFENAVVVNGTIRGFGDNVELWGDGHRIHRLTLENARFGDASFSLGSDVAVSRTLFRSRSRGGNGLSLTDVDGAVIAGNRFEDSGYAVSLGLSSDVAVKANVLRGAGNMLFGISVASGDRNVIRRNLVTGIPHLALGVNRGSGNVVEGNLVAGEGTGLGVTDAVATTVRGNAFLSDAGTRIGIDLGSSVQSKVIANWVSGYQDGLWVTGASSAENLVAKNTLYRNRQDGLIVWPDASGTKLDRNRADRNGDDGLDVRSAATTLVKNRADRNADLGIEAVAGVTDGGGNQARGNGNPAQCVNVRCR